MSDDRLHSAITRASSASNLLNDELLAEAFKSLEDSYIAAWRATKIEDQTGREKLFLAINVVGKVRDHLGSIVNNGQFAQAELNDLIQTAERKKRFGII